MVRRKRTPEEKVQIAKDKLMRKEHTAKVKHAAETMIARVIDGYSGSINKLAKDLALTINAQPKTVYSEYLRMVKRREAKRTEDVRIVRTEPGVVPERVPSPPNNTFPAMDQNRILLEDIVKYSKLGMTDLAKDMHRLFQQRLKQDTGIDFVAGLARSSTPDKTLTTMLNYNNAVLTDVKKALTSGIKSTEMPAGTSVTDILALTPTNYLDGGEKAAIEKKKRLRWFDEHIMNMSGCLLIAHRTLKVPEMLASVYRRVMTGRPVKILMDYTNFLPEVASGAVKKANVGPYSELAALLLLLGAIKNKTALDGVTPLFELRMLGMSAWIPDKPASDDHRFSMDMHNKFIASDDVKEPAAIIGSGNVSNVSLYYNWDLYTYMSGPNYAWLASSLVKYFNSMFNMASPIELDDNPKHGADVSTANLERNIMRAVELTSPQRSTKTGQVIYPISPSKFELLSGLVVSVGCPVCGRGRLRREKGYTCDKCKLVCVKTDTVGSTYAVDDNDPVLTRKTISSASQARSNPNG